MSTYTARAQLYTLNGFKYCCEIQFVMNCHGTIKSAQCACPTKIRPFTILDLLADTMPKWLYTEGVSVEFGYTYANHPRLAAMRQPCLIVTNSWGETKYLLNRFCDSDWMCTVNSKNLAAMVKWWRENRKEFQKPIQKWEWKKSE